MNKDFPFNVCKWCGHRWLPRSLKPPKVCPTCKRVNWATGEGIRTPQALDNQAAKMKNSTS